MQIQPASFSIENFYDTCDELASREIVFKNILQQFHYPPYWTRPLSFETLIHLILEQQVSLASALAALNKLKSVLPEISPAAFLQLTDETLRACYFSRQKMVYGKHLANCLQTGLLQLEKLPALSNDEVSQQLQQVKGIGSWTSDVFMMMCLQRADCFPIGDVALRKSMKTEFGLAAETTHDALLMIAEKWRPYRTIAAYLLWHAYLEKRK